jgi:hypothetical protein
MDNGRESIDIPAHNSQARSHGVGAADGVYMPQNMDLQIRDFVQNEGREGLVFPDLTEIQRRF